MTKRVFLNSLGKGTGCCKKTSSLATVNQKSYHHTLAHNVTKNFCRTNKKHLKSILYNRAFSWPCFMYPGSFIAFFFHISAVVEILP